MEKKVASQRYLQYQTIQNIDRWYFLYFVIMSSFSFVSIWLNGKGNSSVFFCILGILILIGLGLTFLKMKEMKNLREPEALLIDPILHLSAVGVDLEEFSELIDLNLLALDDRMMGVQKNLNELNGKVEVMGKELGNIYTIVSQLAAEEVTMMDAVTKTSEEVAVMFDIVHVVVDEIEIRKKTMENLVTMSEEGREKVQKTNATIQRISDSSGGILKLIDFINKVSKETNLLAINASIEATHSGSDGKGFTVIANQIGKLATLTAQNAREITNLLRENISDYAIASNVSSQSGEAFKFIASEINIVHGTIVEVVQSIMELKSRGSIILAKAKSLDEIAERVRDTSGEVYGELISINTALEETQKLSNLIQEECKNMQDSKSWLNRLTAKMRSKVKEIAFETDKFLKFEQSH